MNANNNKEVRFFQIWIIPREKNAAPRYDQITLDESKMKNNLLQVLSPNPEDEGVWINQDAWFSMGQLDKDFETNYTLKHAHNGVYAFVIEGDVTINGQQLNRRDGLGIKEADTLNIKANSDARLLLMEVPVWCKITDYEFWFKEHIFITHYSLHFILRSD